MGFGGARGFAGCAGAGAREGLYSRMERSAEPARMYVEGAEE